MKTIKPTYLNAQNKIEAREFLFNQLFYKHVIGLPGPDINEYWRRFIADGCKNVQMYENDAVEAAKQIGKLVPDERISYKLGDIYNAPANKKHTLYDLDFCCTVHSVIPHIKKFRDNFIFTFSTRCGLSETVKTFFKARGEKILSRWTNRTPIEHFVFQTTQGRYIMVTYKDTSAMCSFIKI